ncbi:MAG: hypothetical protein JJT94_15675 [Bernardetiaceae bacterium]|nr:hypothetical protein [Bernardetiaceae bacterium]
MKYVIIFIPLLCLLFACKESESVTTTAKVPQPISASQPLLLDHSPDGLGLVFICKEGTKMKVLHSGIYNEVRNVFYDNHSDNHEATHEFMQNYLQDIADEDVRYVAEQLVAQYMLIENLLPYASQKNPEIQKLIGFYVEELIAKENSEMTLIYNGIVAMEGYLSLDVQQALAHRALAIAEEREQKLAEGRKKVTDPTPKEGFESVHTLMKKEHEARCEAVVRLKALVNS